MSAASADPQVARILEKVPGLDAKGAAVTLLEGGITNCNYLVETQGQRLVVRIGGDQCHLLGIDRKNEHACSSIAARLGVGAEVLGFFEEERALVTRFISGERLTPECASRPQNLRRILDAIRRYHGGPPFPGRFSPFDTVRSYHSQARGRGVAFPPEVPRALEILGRIETALGAPAALRPCHNDLLAANFIDDGGAVRIIDWEYAAMGDPFFDLGNLAANQGLDDAACRSVLRQYAGAARKEDLARLHLQRLASDMRESFWGFVQLGISKLDFDYGKYARDHLQRFLAGAAAPDFPRWLAEAKATAPA
jgi:thiamine kinase-like enzyme